MIAFALILVFSADAADTKVNVIHTTVTCPRVGCQITGDSEVRGEKQFVLQCKDESRQIEFKKNEEVGRFVDPVSREESGYCRLDGLAMRLAIEAYENRSKEIEKPKCYLTQWKGQMMFVAEDAKGRCSFQMNPKKAEEFKRKTGIAPLYQCEKDYFLAAKEKAATAIYKKSKTGWEKLCLAPIRVGEKVDDINWDTPPDYYVPEADALGR